MRKKYELVNNVVVEINVTETPYGANATVGERSFPREPFPPSFEFVPPQVGATSLPVANNPTEVMPASNGTGLYYQPSSRSIMMWVPDLEKFYLLHSINPLATPADSGGYADADTLTNGSYYANPGWYGNPLNNMGDVVIVQWGNTQWTTADLDPNHRLYFRTFNQGQGWGQWYLTLSELVFNTPVNLNDAQFQVTGNYQIGAAGNLNVPNDPTFNNNDIYLEVFAAGGQVVQRLTGAYSYGEFYTRSLNDQGGTSWKPWYKFSGTVVP